ncbi:MAG TPA: hypothetical protein VJU18_07390 [Vicinamibacteria bacterium]|nr:hypothetical protein [Vicinamibacteria bacterium]
MLLALSNKPRSFGLHHRAVEGRHASTTTNPLIGNRLCFRLGLLSQHNLAASGFSNCGGTGTARLPKRCPVLCGFERRVIDVEAGEAAIEVNNLPGSLSRTFTRRCGFCSFFVSFLPLW